MCKDCDDEAKRDAEAKALGRLFGVESETVERMQKESTSAELVSDVVLRGSAACRDMLKGYTIFVNNQTEDAGESGLGIAVMVAVNPRFVELADSTGVDGDVAMMMTALLLKDLMAPLAVAMRRAARLSEAPKMPRGDEHSPLS